MSSGVSGHMSVVHASAVFLDGQGVLLMGDSGSGKSTVALNLIETYGAALIGDDRIALSVEGTALLAQPHENLRGLIELRGLGLLRLPFCAKGEIRLAVDLTTGEKIPRLAPAAHFTHDGVARPRVRLDGHDPNTPLKIKWALAALADGFRDDAIYPLAGR